MVLLGEFVKDHSNFYLGILSLLLITLSLALCMDTVRRNLVLVTLGSERVNFFGHKNHFRHYQVNQKKILFKSGQHKTKSFIPSEFLL